MAGTVKHARLETPTARSGLKRGRQPHWRALDEGKVHLGWQCWKGAPQGRWLLRRYVGKRKYRVETLGLADDASAADGERILSFKQASAKAHTIVGLPQAQAGPFTVRQAWEGYIEAKRHAGQDVDNLISRGGVHILPELGELRVEKLTKQHLRSWLAGMASAPAQNRSKDGKPSYRPAPANEDEIRARRATANRVLTMLKAALNHAYDEGLVKNRDAWDRKLKPFREVDAARVHYLTVVDAQRLISAADGDFRPLVQAALETGCRYSELARLEVIDFNPDTGTVAIRKSKSGKARHVILTPEGAAFFQQHCAGRTGSELMFHHAGGRGWRTSEQARRMRAACGHARITPAVSFHTLRHTWASHAVMNGVPLLVVARNLGHADTRMVEKHYGHLAPSFIAEAIRAGAPRFHSSADTTVVPSHSGKAGRGSLAT